MTQYLGPEDTYRELVEESDENWLYGLVAFAVIEEQRLEWMKHVRENNGHLPGHDEITDWYRQQPPSIILRAKGTAESALQMYSNEVVETVLEEHKKDIEQGIIVSEIRYINRFWPQFGVNVAGGFMGAILFAALLTIVAFFVFNDTSPVQIIRDANTTTEEQSNGQES